MKSALIDLNVLFQTAEKAARAAGDRMSQNWQKDLVITEAHHHDLKLELDVQIQELLTNIILSDFPDHTILGEEGGSGSGGKGYEWILDPIDGTVNLAYRIPHFCVSIACRHNDEILIGIVFDPIRNEMFSAIKGQGAFLNKFPIHVSKRNRLEETILALGFSKGMDSIEKCLELYQFYGPRARKLRAMGSAALDMAYIAAGRLDGYIEQGIKIWDIAAGLIILEEAGGKFVLTPRDQPHHYHICAWNGLFEIPKT
jgi:myo-inositol-1(or 4)-monophosphatase